MIEIERATAALLGINVQNLRFSNRILLVPDMKVRDGDWFADRYQAILGTDPVKPGPSDTDNRRQILARSQADELRETISMIDASAKKATTAVAEMLTELNRACDAYKDTHPEVLMVRQAFTELSHRLPLEFAVATGELDALKKATETLRDAATSPEIRLWQARLQAQRGDMFEAWFALHEAVWYDPNHKEARLELSKLEAAFIGSSLRKAHGAIEEAREAFYRYMKDRGYSRDDPKNGWLGQLWAPLRDIDSEMAWSAFTSGASNLLVRFYIDRPAEEQRALSEYEASMTRAYLGLQTILRLTMRGYSVAEISAMKTADLQKALPLKHTNGDDYTPEQVTALGVTIQVAIRNLPDVRAMASADAIELKAAIDKGYWDPQDVGNTWAEWVGDLSSAKNLLLMLAPFSVGSVAGNVVTVERWGSGFWGMSAAEKSIMGSEGIVRGTELIAPLVGWDRAMKVIAGSRQGERLLGLLDRMHKFETGLGTLPPGAPALWARGQQLGWYGGKFVATMAIQMTAGLSAEHVARGIAGERGGEVARFIVEAMMMLAQDHELTLKLLRSGVVEPKRMSRLIHEQYIPVMKQAQERIERRFALKAELQQILASRRQGNTLTPKESEALAKAYGLVPQGNAADLIPNGDPVHDSEIAFKSVIDEATGGDPLGPQYPAAAVEKMESRVRVKQQEISEHVSKAEQLAKDCDEVAASKPQPRSLPITKPGVTAAERPPIPESFRWESTHPTPLGRKSSIPGVQQADSAMTDGDTARAITLYERAQTEVTFPSAETELIEQRLQFARSVLQTPRPPAGAATRELSDIGAAEAERIFARESIWRATEPCAKGTASVLFCDGESLIKEFVNEGEINGELLERMVRAEIVASDLGRALKLDVAAVEARLVRDANGSITKAQFIYRRMGDKSLQEVPPELIFQYRKELAEMEVLANLLNDWDRHAGNYRIVDGGLTRPLVRACHRRQPCQRLSRRRHRRLPLLHRRARRRQFRISEPGWCCRPHGLGLMAILSVGAKHSPTVPLTDTSGFRRHSLRGARSSMSRCAASRIRRACGTLANPVFGFWE